MDLEDMPISEVVAKICQKNDSIRMFWSGAHGWAPLEAAKLLTKARLDWQVSMSFALMNAISNKATRKSDGDLILGWVTLRSLTEGTLKWFLSVYFEDYKKSVMAFDKKGNLRDPSGSMLAWLRVFFAKHIWDEHHSWDSFIETVQRNGNAIHTYESRKLDDNDALLRAIRDYLSFIEDLDSSVPYPDEGYRYTLHPWQSYLTP